MLEYVKCNLCGSWNFTVLYESNLTLGSITDHHYACTNFSYRRHGQIVRCSNCGLVYMNPRPREEVNLEKYQSVVDEIYINEKNGRVATFNKAIEEIERLKSKGKILDVGCYAGFFLEVARKRGWDVCGVEPCAWACEYANKRLGLDVRKSSLKGIDFPAKYFDVVTVWDVLEHLHDPLGTLNEINRILKDDGLLCLTTINLSSLFAKLLGRSWPELMQMHTYYFSNDTLRSLLQKVNFSITGIKNHTRIVRLQYLVGRLQNYSPFFTRLFLALADKLGIGGLLVKVNFGDLIMIYARKSNISQKKSY